MNFSHQFFLFLFIVLASCSSANTDEIRHENIVLTSTQSGAKLDALQHNKDWSRPAGVTTSLAFGGKSRYLCIGDTSGSVCLVDLKKRLRVRQFFQDGYPSRQVSLDPTDTYVLSLSDQLMTIWYLREGSVATTFVPPGNYNFTCYSVTPLQESSNIIAVGTSDGSILVYDISNIHTTTTPFLILEGTHSAAVTSIAMSPHNPTLLASASMDGTLFFSTTAGETIHQLAALDSAITSLSLHADGISCAVSTKNGDVYFYDMRENAPLASFRVRGSASKIQFAPPPKNAPKPPAPDPTKIPQFFQQQQGASNSIRYKAPGDSSTIFGQGQQQQPQVEARQSETEAPPTRVVTHHQQQQRSSPIKKVVTKRPSPTSTAPPPRQDQSYHTFGSNQALHATDLKTTSTQESSQVSLGVQVDQPPRSPAILPPREPSVKKVSASSYFLLY
jgi:WD40 repeat protein